MLKGVLRRSWDGLRAAKSCDERSGEVVALLKKGGAARYRVERMASSLKRLLEASAHLLRVLLVSRKKVPR